MVPVPRGIAVLSLVQFACIFSKVELVGELRQQLERENWLHWQWQDPGSERELLIGKYT
jgi:hypothetical protein